MQLWTPEHLRTLLPAFLIMLLLAAVLRHFLIKKPVHIRMLRRAGHLTGSAAGADLRCDFQTHVVSPISTFRKSYARSA